MSDKNTSENRSLWDDYLNSSREELLNAKTSPIQRYIFNDQEKTVLAEYTFSGRKYVVPPSGSWLELIRIWLKSVCS